MRREIFVVLSTAISLFIVGGALWYQDWRYSLPTPVPPDLLSVPIGERVVLPASLKSESDPRPLLIHFFNPKCPCSRFNIDHVRELTADFGGEVRSVSVLSGEPREDLADAWKGLRLQMPAVFDPEGTLGQSLGVYATPQAAVIDSQGSLAYRGNYNSSRYCRDRRTEFVRLALEAVIARKPIPAIAVRGQGPAYGCELRRKQNKSL